MNVHNNKSYLYSKLIEHRRINFEKIAVAAAITGLVVTILGALAFQIHFHNAFSFMNLTDVKLGLTSGGGGVFLGSTLGLTGRVIKNRQKKKSEPTKIQETKKTKSENIKEKAIDLSRYKNLDPSKIQEEEIRYLLAKKEIENNDFPKVLHKNKYNLTSENQLKLVEEYQRNNRSISSEIKIIKTLVSQKKLFELAKFELQNEPRLFFENFEKYGIEDQETRFQLLLSEKSKSVAWDFIYSDLNKLIDSQEKRFELVNLKFRPDLLTKIIDIDLKPEHKFILAKRIVKENYCILEHLSEFKLKEEQEKEILSLLADINPADIYDQLNDEQIPSDIKSKLAPFHEINQQIEELEAALPAEEFFFRLENILKQVQEITKAKAFSQKLEKRLKKILKARVKKRYIILLSKTIDLVIKYPSSISNNLIFSFTHPNYIDYKEYFFIHYENQETQILGLNGKGMDLYLKKAEFKKDAKKSGHKIYKTTYIEEIAEKLENFKKNPKYKKAVFILNYNKYLESASHLSPLYLEKTNEGIRVFISDSLGEEGNASTNFSFRVLEKVNQSLKEQIKDIFILSPKRQNGGGVCSVFTLNDLLEIIRVQDIFKVLEKEKSPQKNYKGISYHPVNPLPGMMRYTQSVTKIKEYLNGDTRLAPLPKIPDALMEKRDLGEYSQSIIHMGHLDPNNKKTLPLNQHACDVVWGIFAFFLKNQLLHTSQ